MKTSTFYVALLIAKLYLRYSAARLSVSDQKKLEEYNPSDNILQIHIVPHTHDDVGWLKTIEQYFYGRNSTIRHGCVSCILDSVIHALSENPDRKFTYVEMAYFSMWWNEQSDAIKRKVRSLVQNGQLSFANGGWCMHDEATTHFVGMIDQTTLGHDFLKKEFDYIPSVGWQLDPFGHSAVQAYLMTSEIGFNALYLGRIDYQDLDNRYKTSNCEGLWDSSTATENESVIFWGLTGSFSGNYGAPDGFCFDSLCTDDPLYGMKGEVLHKRVIDFLKLIRIQSDRTKGSNVMLTMGSDFQYENALYNYKSLDLLIQTISSMSDEIIRSIFGNFQGLNVFYSNPEIYTEFKYKEYKFHSVESTSSFDRNLMSSLEVKEDDFFPYSDCDHCFWTGYFTSRPGLKRLERFASSFLQASRQIQILLCNSTPSCHVQSIRALEESVAVAQHHDGVSGTSKQHVAYDYMNRIQSGIDQTSAYISTLIKDSIAANGIRVNYAYFCQFLNETRCEASQMETISFNSDFHLILYNALGANRKELISVPVEAYAAYTVTRLVPTERMMQWNTTNSVLLPHFNHAKVSNAAPYKLMVEVILPPASLSIFRIVSSPVNTTVYEKTHMIDFNVTKGTKSVFFKNGTLDKVETESGSINLRTNFGYYTSFEGSEVTPNELASIRSFHPNPGSGAYIFRPNSPSEKMHILSIDSSKTKIIDTKLVTEVHSEYEDGWVKQITRIYEKEDFFDIEYNIGPIPISDSFGKEIVLRYSTDIQNTNVFFTDSNGRDFMKRIRSFRPTWNLDEHEPVSGNYYPVNTAAFIEDDELSFGVITDRSQGVSSLSDAQLEFMLHRRILKDDARGVGEALNETDVGIRDYPPYGDASRIGDGIIITGCHRIRFGMKRSGARVVRNEMDKMFSPVFQFISDSGEPSANEFKDHQNEHSFGHFGLLNSPLPYGLQLITLKLRQYDPLSGNRVLLLRLGNAYGRKEDDIVDNITVNLLDIFKKNFSVLSVSEKTLSGNQEKIKWEENKMKWNTITNSDFRQNTPLRKSHKKMTFTFQPLEIKTFEVIVTPTREHEIDTRGVQKQFSKITTF